MNKQKSEHEKAIEVAAQNNIKYMNKDKMEKFVKAAEDNVKKLKTKIKNGNKNR